MTKHLSLLIAGAAAGLQLQAQTLTVQPGQLQFGSVTELQRDSLPVTITNPLGSPVNVTGIRFFNTYREPAFSVRNSAFTVPAGGTYTLYVRFSPKHNIQHNTEMVLLTDSHRGHVSVDLTGQGVYSKTYYSSSQNKAEEQLKTALKATISAGYNGFSYNTARDKMFMTIDNKKVNGQGAAVNTLECVYTGRQVTGYTSRSDAQNQNFNTEHTFPQGFFNSATPMVSDLHHLFPTDNNANNVRGNDRFGMVTGTPTWQQGGSKSNGTVFEPRDVQKGASARALLYFVIRYQDYSNHVGPQEAILKTWNFQFQPTTVQRKRNDDIFAEQNNRNPFVDYPQLADRINSFSGTSTAPVSHGIFASDSVIYYGMLNGTATYSFVIYNAGNQPLSLSNLTLNDPALSFATGSGTNVTVQPGEATTQQITLNWNSTAAFNSTLTFQTSIPGQGTISVPVLANQVLFTSPDAAAPADLRLFPNPVKERLVLEPGLDATALYSVVVYNSIGQPAAAFSGLQGRQELSLGSLPAGVYLLQTAGVHGRSSTRFIKLP